MNLLMTIEILATVCGLQATHRPTIAGLFLQSCLDEVSLLGDVWNNGAAPADVHRSVQQCVFENTVFKITYKKSTTIRVSCTTTVNEAVVICVNVGRS